MLFRLVTGLLFIFVSVSSLYSQKVKNIILVIADGMGPQQLSLLLAYKKSIAKEESNYQKFMSRASLGQVMPGSESMLVVDSAMAATELASGIPSRPELMGLDRDGSPVKTIIDLVKKQGGSAGIVSDTRITHATPGAFYAHSLSRIYENEIAVDLLSSGVDVALSGGLSWFLPQKYDFRKTRLSIPERLRRPGRRPDRRDLLQEFVDAEYSVVFSRDRLQSSQNNRILGLFTSSAMPSGIWEGQNYRAEDRDIPTLAEMTGAALKILSQNPKGFFLMVEAGQIDWAGHNNDAGALLHEMLRFDRALGTIFSEVRNRNDTLVVITSDHETGGFGFGYSKVNLPAKSYLGKGLKAYQPRYNYAPVAVLKRVYAQKKTLYQIFMPHLKKKLKAGQLQKRLNENLSFQFSLEDANYILREEKHRFYTPGHNSLGSKQFPALGAYNEFYIRPVQAYGAKVARVIARQSNITWSTGSHTATLVNLVAFGRPEVRQRFKGLHSTSQVGRLLQEALLTP